MRRVGVPEPTLPLEEINFFAGKFVSGAQPVERETQGASEICGQSCQRAKGRLILKSEKSWFHMAFLFLLFFLGVVTFLSHGKCWKLLHLNLGAAVCQTC